MLERFHFLPFSVSKVLVDFDFDQSFGQLIKNALIALTFAVFSFLFFVASFAAYFIHAEAGVPCNCCSFPLF